MTDFRKALAHVLDIEGVEDNHPLDRGGHTKYGITERTARGKGYRGSMSDLPLDLAVTWYREDYWDVNDLDHVALIDFDLAEEVFEAGVNCSPARAGTWLQRGLNVLNRNGRDYDDVRVDGRVGPQTIGALRRLYEKRGKRGIDQLRKICNVLQGAFYITIAESDSTQEAFVFGWFRQRVRLS